MAASDGRTSVELYRTLTTLPGVNVVFTASDAASELTVVRQQDGNLVAVLDQGSARLLQIISPPFVFNVVKPENPWLYPLNRLIYHIHVRRRVDRLLASSDQHVARTALHLLSPECSVLLREEPNFSFVAHDIRNPLINPVHTIRAMNILNRSYFPDHALRDIIATLHRSLLLGGLLVTGSDDGAGTPVNAGIYQRHEIGFQLLRHTGMGSPVDSLIPRTDRRPSQ
jgi:hypothetical protein